MNTETMKNSKIFHPFLIAFFPIIAVYSVNIGLIQLEQFIFPTLLIVGSAFLFFLCVYTPRLPILKSYFHRGVKSCLQKCILVCMNQFRIMHHLKESVSDATLSDTQVPRVCK